MEEATPIYQLQQQTNEMDSKKTPVDMMSYSDVLKNLKDENVGTPEPMQIQQQSPQQQQYQQPQQYHQQQLSPQQQQQYQQQQQQQQQQYHESNYYPRSVVNPNQPVVSDDTSSSSANTFQNEMLTLLAVYILIHTTQFQQMVKTKIPGIINENGSSSVVGTLINGVLVIVLWNISKRFLLKYIKDL